MTSFREDSPMGGILPYGGESLAFSVLFKFFNYWDETIYIKNVLCLVHQYKS